MNNTKANHYAATILSALSEVLDEQIDLKELEEGDNLTDFFHALSNLVPNSVYNSITGENINILQFNHIANSLCFQYGKSVKGGGDGNE